MKKISIIVPVYNIESYIERCLNSIIRQTYTNIEVIIVNDGSKDKSGYICDMFANKDSRVKVIHTMNKGLSAARNEGIKNSAGDYIMFVDGDDFITLNCIQDIMNIIIENVNVDIIIGKKIEYYNEQKKIEDSFNYEINKFKNRNGTEVLTYLFEEIPTIIWSAWLSIYKKELLVENNLYFTEGITSEDLDLVPRIYMKAYEIRPYNTPFYYYRESRPNSIISTINNKRFEDIIYIIEMYTSMLQKPEYDDNFRNAFLRQLANVYSRYVAIIGYVPVYERKKVCNEMKNKKNILQYSTGIRAKYIKYSTKYFGFKISYSLYKYIKEINLFVCRAK